MPSAMGSHVQTAVNSHSRGKSDWENEIQKRNLGMWKMWMWRKRRSLRQSSFYVLVMLGLDRFEALVEEETLASCQSTCAFLYLLPQPFSFLGCIGCKFHMISFEAFALCCCLSKLMLLLSHSICFSSLVLRKAIHFGDRSIQGPWPHFWVLWCKHVESLLCLFCSFLNHVTERPPYSPKTCTLVECANTVVGQSPCRRPISVLQQDST